MDRWLYSAGPNAGEVISWSSLIEKLPGWHPIESDLRRCPSGDEHEMVLAPSGHAVRGRCGVGVFIRESKPWRVATADSYARSWGARPCEECGELFEPRRLGYHTCPDCYRFEPPATRRQLGYLVVLAGVLGVEVPACHTPAEAARAIDELLLFIGADPDVVHCAADGCKRFVNRTRPRAHTFCGRHRGEGTAA